MVQDLDAADIGALVDWAREQRRSRQDTSISFAIFTLAERNEAGRRATIRATAEASRQRQRAERAERRFELARTLLLSLSRSKRRRLVSPWDYIRMPTP